MNPYDVLEIEPKATEHQIKVAYRRCAKATHPDNGGNGEDFALVSKAYAILMDPEARAKFDETGSIEEVAPLTIRQRMIQIIAEMFNDALRTEVQRGTPLKHLDLMSAMRHSMDAVRKQLVLNHEANKKAVGDRKFLLKRITRPDDGENLFATMIRQQLSELEPLLKRTEIDMKAADMAFEELQHYKSEVELVQAIQMMQFGGSFAKSTGSGQIWGFR